MMVYKCNLIRSLHINHKNKKVLKQIFLCKNCNYLHIIFFSKYEETLTINI